MESDGIYPVLHKPCCPDRIFWGDLLPFFYCFMYSCFTVFILRKEKSYLRIESWEKTGIPKNIAVIQGNIKEDIKQSPKERFMILQTYLDLIKKASKHNVDIIILPESAIPVYPLYQEQDVYLFYTTRFLYLIKAEK